MMVQRQSALPSRGLNLVGAAVVVAVLVAVGVHRRSGTDVSVEPAVQNEGSAPEASGPPPDCVDSMAVPTKAGQLVIVLADDPQTAAQLIADGAVGGVALRAAQTPAAVAGLADLRSKAAIPIFVASDEEGGTVQRLKSVTGAYPSAAKVAQTMTPGQAATNFGAFAAKLVANGVTMIFGPSVDTGSGSGLGTRSYSDDANVVAVYGTSVVNATMAAGAIPVVKHWPGIGSGNADTHDKAATVSDIETIRARDLVPFDAAIAAGVPAVMVSHAIVPGLTDGQPASLSRAAITGELREREGFDGLVVTDSLGMGAIASVTDQESAAVTAIGAGADIALVSGAGAATSAHLRLVDAILNDQLDAGQVDESVRRVLRAKNVDLATCTAKS